MIAGLAVLAALPMALAFPLTEREANIQTCRRIASVISSVSHVFYPGTGNYTSDMEHWVPSSAQNATCAVEPGSSEDVSKIIKILADVSTPFAIKGGGHSGNVGFSSTTGVQIAMTRLNQVIYDNKTSIVEIGPGNLWDNVYQKLDKYGVVVVGGRVSGVGAAGFSLGGGFGWTSNRHGLTVDTIVALELVLPSGEIISVSPQSYPDLYFGLRGGFNNFGIVTKIFLKAFPQGKIWGGLINWNAAQMPAAIDALTRFAANNTDPDAVVVIAVIGSNFTQSISLLTFYNGPTPGKTFDEILSLPYDTRDLATRSYYENFIAVSPPYLNSARQRGRISSPRVSTLSKNVILSAVDQVKYWSTTGKFTDDLQVSCAIEPFISSALIKDATASAWPHSTFLSPLSLNVFWNDAKNDKKGLAAMQAMKKEIEKVANSEADLSDVMLYPNYSLDSVPLKDMYGANLPRLKTIAKKYDPTKVMLRTGGYHFQ